MTTRAKRFTMHVRTRNGRETFLKSIRLQPGTVYADEIAFTTDRKTAALFDRMNTFQDAADAVDLFLGHLAASCADAPRNARGTLYETFE